MGRALTTKEFISKSVSKHGNKYDYSKTVYIKSAVDIEILCPIHGVTWQTPRYHLNHEGCKKCGIEKQTKSKILTKEEFIKKALKKHGNKFDYSITVYTDTNTHLEITCLVHGAFPQTPTWHLQGHGCPKCAGKNKTTEDFIKESVNIHGNKYDYSKTIYIKNEINVEIICPIHGKFSQDPSNHLSGKGCKKCGTESGAKKQTHTKEQFIEKAFKKHGDKYNYSKVTYMGSYVEIEIICPKHGSFPQTPHHHLNGEGCPKCNCSHAEQKIISILNSKNLSFSHNHKFDDCIFENTRKKAKFDFWLKDLNLAIEYDGELHYKTWRRRNTEKNIRDLKDGQQRDRFKDEYCKKHKITLLRIPYTQFKELDKVLSKFLKEKYNIN